MKFKRYSSTGFTLIELLVTLAVVVILASLAAPSLNEFAVKSRITSVGNEFTTSVLKSRNEAISKNTCVTMCLSTSVNSALPICNLPDPDSVITDWQVGWIVFLNPTCDKDLETPGSIENVLLARQSVGDDYSLVSQDAKRKILFNSRGYPSLTSADEFDIIYKSSNNPLTNKYAFNICLDKVGRTRTISTYSSC